MLRHILIVLALGGLLQGCAGISAEQVASDELDATDEEMLQRHQLSQIQLEIEELALRATCTIDAQCQTIGVGTRPCGGAEYYYAYSQGETDMTTLLELVSKYNQIQKKLPVKSAEMAECYHLSDPGARCVDRRCMINFVPFGK